jgi:hypothetical protein
MMAVYRYEVLTERVVADANKRTVFACDPEGAAVIYALTCAKLDLASDMRLRVQRDDESRWYSVRVRGSIETEITYDSDAEEPTDA